MRISRQSYSVCYAAAFLFTYKLATTNYINDRGVKIDTELVQQAIACDLMLSDATTSQQEVFGTTSLFHRQVASALGR